MENTLATPPLNNASGGALPAEKTGAISQAISQAVPPKAPTGPRTQASNPPNDSQPPRQTTPDNGGDKDISLEDFEQEENPLTPKPVNRVKEQTEKQSKSKVENEQKIEDQNNKEETTKQEEEDKSDNKLELDIKLEEGADKQEEGKNKGGRDYSGFKPEHVEYLKKLPNHLFEQAKKDFQNLYKIETEYKTLKDKFEAQAKGGLPDNYYEHQEAYTLSPKYTELSNEIKYDNFEENHYSQQLARVKRGQAWSRLKGYDKQGQPVFETVKPLVDGEGKVQSDVDSEIELSRLLDLVRDQQKEHSQQLLGLKNQHELEFKKSKEGLDGVDGKFFKSINDLSAANKLPNAVKADMEMATRAFDEFAPAFKSNPMKGLLVKSYAVIKFQQRQIMKLMQEFNMIKEGKEDQLKAGPGKTVFKSGTSSGGDKIISEKDFED